MELLTIVIVLATIGFAAWLLYLGIETTSIKEEIAEIKSELPSEAEVKKMKKNELIDLCQSSGITVDAKLTKAKIIEEIDRSR